LSVPIVEAPAARPRSSPRTTTLGAVWPAWPDPGLCRLEGGDVVKRRFLRIGLIIGSALALLPGCESLDHYRRPRSFEDVKPEAEESSESKGFFKPSRVSGAMSSEGREIEQSLGIR
jgi:hypothetical protein